MTALPTETADPKLTPQGQGLSSAYGSGHLLVSFSGGRSSALMARLVQTAKAYDGYQKIYCYANTGREMEETLKFIHECDTRWGLGVVWLEAVVNPEKGKGTTHRVVTYETAYRNTDEADDEHPFMAVVEKYGLPSNSFPHCTREMKLRPIASYLSSLGIEKYTSAIGIRADEPHRAKVKPGYIYPLIEFNMTEPMVRRYWARQTFDLGLKDYEGNCDLCFKKSLRKRLTILREHPEVAPFWIEQEGLRIIRGQMRSDYFDRSGLSVRTLEKMAADPALVMAVDKHDARLAEAAKHPELFEAIKDIDLDFETACLCESAGGLNEKLSESPAENQTPKP